MMKKMIDRSENERMQFLLPGRTDERMKIAAQFLTMTL